MPYTILFIAANPQDTQALRIGAELRDVVDNLKNAQYAQHLHTELILAARAKDIGQAMLQYKPRIIHFAGHGEGDAGLVLEDDEGLAHVASTQALQSLFKTLAETLDCVVLNVCYSKVQATAIADYIPVVIGMREVIPDETALKFAQAFYQAIGNGEPYGQAYDYAVSMLQLHGLEADIPQLIAHDDTKKLSLFREVTQSSLPLLDDNPYLGLEAFQETHADRFFGRCALTLNVFEQLEALHQQNAARFLAILGPSGSGKSSLAQAGLIPVLKAEWDAIVIIFKPTEHPLESLARALAEVDKQGAETITRAKHEYLHFLKEVEGLRSIASDLLAKRTQPLVLLIDQFEETFIAKPSDPQALTTWKTQQRVFIAGLLEVVQAKYLSLWVVITLRSDFLNETQAFAELNQLVSKQSILVPIMQEAELRDAIALPAKQAGFPLDAATVTLLLEQSTERPGALPLLQFALSNIWEGMTRGVPPAETLQQIGGVGGALADSAEALLKGLSKPKQQQLVRRAFLKLVQLGEGSPDTLRQVSLSEMVAAGETIDEVRGVLQQFATPKTPRLIILDAETVQFTHEALLKHWGTLRKWVEEGREDIRFERQLAMDVRRWEENGRHRDWLTFTPASLKALKAYQKRHAANMTTPQSVFFQASCRERRRRVWLAHAVKFIIIMLLAGLVGGGWFIANRQENSRIQSLFLADLAQQQLAKGKYLAATNLALAALPTNFENPKHPIVTEAQQALFDALKINFSQHSQVLTHQNVVKSAAFSPDGKYVVTASADKTAKLWHLPSNSVSVLKEHQGEVYSAIFSSDGQYILTTSENGTASLWNAQNATRLQILEEHTKQVNYATFSPNNKQIITVSSDKTARLWDINGKFLRKLKGHEGVVTYAAYSRDGQYVVTASGAGDSSARLWDVESGTEITVFNGHTDTVWYVEFSPNGEHLVTASRDETARLWDIKSGKTLVPLDEHTNAVTRAVYSPNGERIVTTSWDKTVQLWDLSNDKRIKVKVLMGHTSRVNNVVYSPDGRYIMTASGDPRFPELANTVRLWDAQSGESLAVMVGHENAIWHAAFSPNGKQIVTASQDNTVRLWDIHRDSSFGILRGHQEGLNYATYSPDNQYILTTSGDNTAKLWDVATGKAIRSFQHEDDVTYAEYSPDGQQFVTVSGDNTARLWDADSGEELFRLKNHELFVTHAAYSPDGKQIVTTSADSTARLWDTTTGEELSVLRGHTNRINQSSYSLDGKQIITASDDKTIRLWNAQSGELLGILEGHQEEVNHAIYSPDGQYIVSVSQDNTARLWNAKGKIITILKEHTDNVNHIAFSYNGQYFVTVSKDKTGILWELPNQKVFVLKGHEREVSYAAFSPDDKYIITASKDKTAQLWEVKNGKTFVVFKGHQDEVPHAAFSPNGQHIITSSYDKTARLWRVFSSLASMVKEAQQRTHLYPLTCEQRKKFFLLEAEAEC